MIQKLRYKKAFDLGKQLLLTSRLIVYRVVSLIVFSQCSHEVLSQPAGLPAPELITSREGLPQAFIPAILQDKKGFMWLATRDGLCRYDGQNFKVFQPDPINDTSLSSSAMADLVMDHTGDLWIMSETGDIDHFNPLTEKFENVSKRPSYARYPGRQKLHRFLIDKQQRLWGMLEGQGIFYYDLKTNVSKQFRNDPHQAESIASEKGMCIAESKDGTIWIATENGLQKFNELTKTFTSYPLKAGKNGQKYEIGGLFIRENGNILITSREDLYLVDTLSRKVLTYPLPARGDEWWRTSIVMDQKSVVYFDQDDLLFRFTEKHGVTLVARWKHNGEESASMFIDRSEVLWIGTDGVGIRKYDLRAIPFRRSTYEIGFTPDILKNWLNIPEAQIPDAIVKSNAYFFRYTFDGEGNMWFNGGAWPVYKLDFKTKKISGVLDNGAFVNLKTSRTFGYNNNAKPPIPLATDPGKTVWAYQYNTAYSYDTSRRAWVKFPYPISEKPMMQVMQFVVDQSALWMATELDGLLKIDRKTGSKTRYVNEPKNLHSISSNSLFCIFSDRLDSDKLWIGTFGSGLCQFSKKTGRFRRFTRDDGLPNNVIYSAIPDKMGNIWIGTNRGLCKLDSKTLKTQTYTSEDGLLANEFNRLHFLQTPAGHIALGGIEGITSFDPNDLKSDDFQPTVEVTGIEINNMWMKQGSDAVLNGLPPQAIGELTLEHDQNFLKVQFAALQFNKPGKNRYRYRLEGVNKDWVYGSRPEAIYTNVVPGSYKLHLNATNTSGVWSKHIRTIDINIQPPFWATWWAYTIYALLTAGLLAILTQGYISRIRLKQTVILKKQEAEQLKTLDQMKTHFFSNITHEFRTPLTLILSPIEEMVGELRDTGYAKRLSSVRKNAQNLLVLINQLMELSKLEASAMNLNIFRGNLEESFTDWVKPFEQQAISKQIELKLVTDIHGEYWFDRDKLERITTNLLSNALKFTLPGGKVTVILSAEAHSIKEGVQLLVTDTGIGIPADQLPFIFDRFYQVPPGQKRQPVAESNAMISENQAGTGIGLSLVKELVLLMGGSVDSNSTEKVGSTFKVWLPIEKALPAEEQKPNPPQARPPNTKTDKTSHLANSVTILIVEDNDDLAEYIHQSLPPNYEIERAVNGLEGLKKAIELIPDLIISDVIMPEMSGIELCQKIKNDFHTSHIPVILLTARSSMDSRLAGLSQGADDYITKPFHIPELLLRVQNLLTNKIRQREKIKADLTQPGDFKTETFTKETDPFIQNLYAILEKNLDNSSFSIDEILADVALSRMSLHRKIKTITGLSTGDLIRLYRLKRATQYLRSGKKVAETAYLVGFETPSHFAKIFREQYSLTPTQFLEQKVNQ